VGLIAFHQGTFANFYVIPSLCCPARTRIVTGKDSRNTGAQDNVGTPRVAIVFADRAIVARRLRVAGHTLELVEQSRNELWIYARPWGVEVPLLSPSKVREVDGSRRHMIESLQAVDREVAYLIRALERAGRLDHTIIAFTSDNGFLWGEHRLTSKVWPYEESI